MNLNVRTMSTNLSIIALVTIKYNQNSLYGIHWDATFKTSECKIFDQWTVKANV